jgi:NADH:ubiquinone oxidoreductase subunit K
VFILEVSADEVSVGLALALKIRRRLGTLDVDALRKLKD